MCCFSNDSTIQTCNFNRASTLLFWFDATLNHLSRACICPGLDSDFVLELNKSGFDLQVTLSSSAPWSPVYTMEILLAFLLCVIGFGDLIFRVF